MKRISSILCGILSLAVAVAALADEPAAPKAAAAQTRAAPAKAAAKKATAQTKAAPSKAAAKKPTAQKNAAAPRKDAASKAPRVKKLPPPPALPASRIVEKNLAARGGEKAWREVNTLKLTGELDAGGKEDVKLPFVLSQKRPLKSRLEIKFQEQTAVQVWDGQQGWKVRPFLNRNEVEAFTAAETKAALETAELDGPLVDFAKKGTKVRLAGTEVVEGRNTYELELALKDGGKRHLWIDAKTFLEVKIDGEPRKLDNKVHKVAVFYRDFKTVKGLKVPFTLETVVEGVRPSRKMSIKTVLVNPPLADALFVKPQLGLASLR